MGGNVLNIIGKCPPVISFARQSYTGQGTLDLADTSDKTLGYSQNNYYTPINLMYSTFAISLSK